MISCKAEATDASNQNNSGNITFSGGKQIIEVVAKGGYSPKNIEAKAGLPTILVMKSEGAYGCERAFYLPDFKISKLLPENGKTEFDLGTPAKGTEIVGLCSMGMYYFQILFN
ncbi:MAG: cupredoxin domain-containing protein [Candidatus Humimicrobiaceae bacterium]